jgi:hypothetical protein
MASGTRARSLVDRTLTVLTWGLAARRGVELVEVLVSGRWSRRRLSGLATRPGKEPAVQLVCVVPMYLEQAIAAETVRFWHGFAERTGVAAVSFVTSVKERPEVGPTTRDIVAAELARLGNPDRLRLVHCEEVTRFRAAQLNLAVQQVRANSMRTGHSPSSTWVAVYNADSRPSASTCAELAGQSMAEPRIRVFQQLVDYVVPERPGAGLVAVGNSALQSWWTRSHYWTRNTVGRRDSWLAATVPFSTFGHGEFVRLDFLEDIGGFPDFAYADGLLLGWICRLRGEPIGLLASRDCAEVPRTGRDLVTQQAAWMRGLLNFDATVAWCHQHGQVRLSRTQVAALRAAHLSIPIIWGLSTAVLAAGTVLLGRRIIARSATVADAAKLACLLSYPVVPTLALAGTGERPPGVLARLAGAAASWPLEGVGFWPAVVSHLRRSQRAPTKTPR